MATGLKFQIRFRVVCNLCCVKVNNIALHLAIALLSNCQEFLYSSIYIQFTII